MLRRAEAAAHPYLTIVDGKTLSALVRAPLYRAQSEALLAPSPSHALRRIEETFGARPDNRGANIAGIERTRETLWELTHDPTIANALLITAPHTHWDDTGLPMVISARENAYRIGPSPPDEARLYTPVSFAFGEDGPLPYEWADDTIPFDKADLARALAAICATASALACEKWPLGLSLNFRFKALFSSQSVATMEYQDEGATPEDPAGIVRADDALSGQATAFEQVAWHAHCERCLGLTPEELALLQTLRRSIPDAQSLRALRQSVGLPPSNPG